MDESSPIAETPDAQGFASITDQLIVDAQAHDAMVRAAREALAILESHNVYLPAPAGYGFGTRIASLLLYGLTNGREEMFRNRHNVDRLQMLQVFLADAERRDLWSLVKNPEKQAEARKRLMYLHRELRETFRQILLCYSETTLND